MAELKQRILDDIVQKVSQASYNDVAALLLRAKVLCEPRDGGRQRTEQELESEKRGGKRLIWQSGVIELLVDALYRDYLKVENDWSCAADLCQFTVMCCTTSEGLTHDPQFRQRILQKAANGLWQLLHNVHQRVDRGIDEDAMDRTNTAFRKICNSSYQFFIEMPDYITDAWKSPNLMSMLEEKTDRSIDWNLIDLCMKMTKINPSSVFDLTSCRRWRIMDTIMSRLRRTDDPKLANGLVQVMICWLDAYPLLLDSLLKRYGEIVKGTVSRWHGHGFDSYTRVLMDYLENGVVADRESQQVHQAAAKIQAFCRGYIVRRRMAKMKAGFIKLQQLFRIRRKQSADIRLTEEKKEEMQHEKRLKQHRKKRRYLEKKFQTVSCIHASLVDRYLESESDRVATIIQAAWRGYVTRRKFGKMKNDAKLDKAARIIQRKVRQWYENRRLIKDRSRSWPTLTETRREDLQMIIDRYQERHKIHSGLSKQTQKEMHERAQALLADHYKRYYANLQSYQKRDATLARIQMNIRTLEDAPKLDEMREGEIVAFTVRNSVIANRAMYAHKKELRFQQLPLWKQLLQGTEDKVKSNFEL